MDTAKPSAIPSITVPALRAMLGTPDAPLTLDVREPHAFGSDPRMIPASLRRRHDAVDRWAPALPSAGGPRRTLVAYCVHGHEVSQGVARRLAALGLDARFLAGGFEAWTAAGAPTMTTGRVPNVQAENPSRWVTRERPKIDRIACPWLVRRYIDPLAEFHYVAPDRVLTAAGELGAIPYDVPGVQLSHRGERCSFDAMLDDFGLDDPALRALATIVRGADTARLDLAPQSPGLLALSLGLSALYRDDHEMLEHGIAMYDALHAWLRAARDEVHNAKLFER
jgi:rhodanese-related sulfurtransferase